MTDYLEPEQADLFEALLSATNSVPRQDRQPFMVVRTFGGDHLQGNGLERKVLYEDVVALDDVGLIRVTGHHKKGSGFNFVLPAGASTRFAEVKVEELDETPSGSGLQTQGDRSSADADVDPTAVMVVHGRNEAAHEAMFDFLRTLGLQPLEWGELIAETKKAAPYVGEILEEAFRKAKAVVVLLTPDDEVQLREEHRRPDDEDYEGRLTPQARPNVLFEAGMALASHPEQTVLVEVGRLRPFSDIHGRHTVRLRDSRAPLRDIAQRLEQAGCRVVREGDDWDDPALFREAIPDSNPASTTTPNPDASARVQDLNEDMRRWILDRDKVVEAEARQVTSEMNSQGLLYSGAHRRGQAAVRERALHQYRDEVTAKRREYREIARFADDDLPVFGVGPDEQAILSSWRGPVEVSGGDRAEIDDPTSAEREPGIRKFESEGDSPATIKGG